jgi:dihydroorotase-like cyclic amidohydrolase
MLVKNANLVVTMNADTANEVLDLTGHIVLPELINIHQPRVLDAHPRC